MTLICCAHHQAHTPYYYIHNKEAEEVKRIIPVYIDKDFGDEDLIKIEDAINQWNYALNGYIKITIIMTKFNMEDSIIKEARDGGGWIILKIDSGSRLFKDDYGSLTLAFCDRIGGYLLFMVRDRFSNEDMFGISLHEIGHLLGARHLGYGLMNSVYYRESSRCVDRSAAESVAEYQGLPIGRINYCVFGEIK